MIWIICFLIAVLITAVVLKIAFDKNMGRTRIIFAMLGCLVIAYVLYIPPFFLQYEFTAALLGCFINAMQVISLDADYLFFYDLIAGELGAGVFTNLYFAFLAAMHFLLPAVSAMTAVTVIMRCLTQLQIGVLKRHRKPLYIFTQINYKSVLLARDIYSHNKTCDILFLDDPDDSDYTDLQQELHCIILNETAETVRPDSARREVHYYCISENQEENLTAALSIMSRLEQKERRIQENNHVFLFSSDPMAEPLIDSIRKGFVSIRLINEQRTDAYNLLERYPLFHYANGQDIHVLLCGFSNEGEAFLRAAVWCGQVAGYRLRFSVVGKNIENRAADFRANFPGLFSERYHIEFFSYGNELEFQDILRTHCGDATYIVTACDSERETIEKAVGLRRFFYRTDAQFRYAPPIFAYIETAEKASAVAALTTAEAKAERRMPFDIIPYGMASELYTYKNITDSDLELLSKNVHLVYEDIFCDDGIDVVSALERYNLFEVNKSSNRANALHIRYKLAMLGLDYTDDPNAEEVDLSDYLNDETLDRLTVAEHDRWMAFLESEGWVESTIEQAHAYQASGISKGRHNCPLLKLHPYICPFEELQDRSDRLGLPDSTVYDRELIARIPDILHDKWGVSGKRYKMIKIQTEQGG